jgi:hypothetical protein
MEDNLVDVILFGSTCKNVILSYGSFSGIIGYLSYYSTVYHKKNTKKWDDSDMFRDNFTKIGEWIEF